MAPQCRCDETWSHAPLPLCCRYAYFVLAGAIFVCTFTPLLPRVAPALMGISPSSVAPGSPSYLFRPEVLAAQLPMTLQVLGWVNIVTFLPVSHIVILVFFKTHYSITTVGGLHSAAADAGDAPGVVRRAENHARVVRAAAEPLGEQPPAVPLHPLLAGLGYE